jgi:hypothetical protein
MTNIRDQVARGHREFRPETTQEFFALQLARKLNDAKSVRSYVTLVERFSEDALLRLYRNTLERGGSEGIAERFQTELRRWTRKEGYERADETGSF